MRYLSALMLLSFLFFPRPAAAQQQVRYHWHPADRAQGYAFYTNPGTGVWQLTSDAITDTTYTVTQPSGTAWQHKVVAWNLHPVPVMQGLLLIGVTLERQYGVDSTFSDPNTISPSAPGGCGRPIKF